MTRGRTWIELNQAAWRANLLTSARLAPHAQVMPIVKANAYGHGLAQALQTFKTSRIWGVGVAHGEEALLARQLGWRANIAVLSSWQPSELAELVEKHISVVVHSFTTLKAVQRLQRAGKSPRIHLKLDTGTSRIGFLPSERDRLHREIHGVHVEGIFSHLANAEESSVTRTKQQIKRFTTINSWGDKSLRHLACSAAIIRYPSSQFDLVRPGLMFYGYWPTLALKRWSATHRPSLKLRPVLSWYVRLAAVKRIPAGTSVGYSSTWTAKRATTLGVVPVGYADGIDRRLSNRGRFFLHGRPVPIIGRVCMNLTMLDLGRSTAKTGEIMEIAGPHQSMDDLAGDQLFTYEALTSISSDIPRILV